MKGLSRARLSGLFIFFAVTITLKSQSFSEHNISVYPETYKPPVFDKKKSFEAFLQKHDRYFKLDIRKEEYAHLVTETLSELNNSFTIYEDLPEETAYLNKVLRATIPDSLIKENVKVRIIRDPSVNAFSIEDGSINLNAGFLSIVNSEAELAAVISHEYGHYEQMHMRRRYKKFKNVMLFNTIMAFIPLYGAVAQTASTAGLFHSVRRHEKRCDCYAVDFFGLNKYSLMETSRPFKRFYKMEKLDRLHLDHEKSFDMFRTHPASKKRVKAIDKGVAKLENSNRKSFLVDSVSFTSLKKRATDEVIYQLFINNHFDQCIEQCYINLLMNPEDEFYLYFLLESTRMKLLINPSASNQRFITSNYKVKGSSEIQKSIHHQLPLIYSHLWEDVSVKLKGELSDPSQVEFMTYEEALTYFKLRAVKSCKSCYPAIIRSGERMGVPSDSNHVTPLQKILHDEITATNAPPLPVTPVFFNKCYTSIFDSRRYSTREFNKGDDEMQMLKEYISNQSEDQMKMLDSIYNNQLNFREERMLKPQLEILSDKIIFSNYNIKRKFKKKHFFRRTKRMLQANVNAYQTVSALNKMMLKKGYHSLIFVDFVITDSGQNILGQSRKKMNVLLYYYNLNTGLLTRKYLKYKFKFMSEFELKYFYPQLINDVELFKSEMKKRL